MEFKITKCLSRFKDELPPINRPTRSTSSKVIKVNTKHINKYILYKKKIISNNIYTYSVYIFLEPSNFN